MSITTRTTTAAGLLVAGVSFAAYPALRPYGPETGMAGAADFGSTAWLAAHVLGMVGFVSLAFALRSAADGSALAVDRPPGPQGGDPDVARRRAAAALLRRRGLRAQRARALRHRAR